MRVMIAPAILASLAATPALADSVRCVDPSGPQSIAEFRAAGEGAVVGTVASVGRHGFVLDDGTSRIPVRAKRLSTADLRPDARATVVGRLDRDAIRAQQVVREDGSAAALRTRDGCGPEFRAERRPD